MIDYQKSHPPDVLKDDLQVPGGISSICSTQISFRENYRNFEVYL